MLFQITRLPAFGAIITPAVGKFVRPPASGSLRNVIAGRRVDDRAGRLASATPDDNRISYGCVNVPARFYDGVIKPLFTGTVGIVYILPETRPLRSVFAMTASAPDAVPH